MMRVVAFRTLVLGAVVWMAMIGTPGHAKESAEPLSCEARTFQSSLALRVIAVTETTSDAWDCAAGQMRVVGRTPAAEPLHIPVCKIWYVEPIDVNIEDDALRAIAREVRTKSIPGLSLTNCVKLTDRGMKHLAGLKSLMFFGIQGTVITSVGMDKLKRLPSVRILDARPGALSVLGWLKGWKSLETLDLSGHRVLQGPKLKALRTLKKLRVLKLNHISLLNDRGMEEVLSLKKLRELHVAFGRSLTPAGIETLTKHRALQKLDVSGIKVTDKTLEKIATMPALTSLAIRGAHDVTNAGAAHLGSMTSLRELDIRGCFGISGQGFKALAALRNLEIFRVMATKGVRESDLILLKDMVRLVDLEISHVKPFGDEGMAYLSKATELKRLSLHETSVTGHGLENIKGAKKLHYLKLRGCTGISDVGLNHLEALPLTELDLGKTMVSDKGLASVGAIKSLEVLSLAKCEALTHNGLSGLVGLTNLTELDVSDVPGVTDVAVIFLAQLTSLRVLRATGSGLSVTGARALQESIPRCQVIR